MAEVPGVGAIVESIRARIAQIEEQLRQHRALSDELERLRDALGRLERGVGARVRGRRSPAPSTPASSPATKRTATAKPAAGTRRRGAAPRGQTRARILEALKDGPKTAGEIAEATGIPRGSASTTLSKLAKSGDVVKAERGYKLPEPQTDTGADAP
jgi:DNA-binding transcriptional ArsR family regulator